MKRLFMFLATFSLVETIGRRPALAGVLMLLGVGGGAGVANLMTPSILPQAAAYFNQNQSFGTTTNGLKPNGGTAGAMDLPTDVTGSFGLYFELNVDSALPYGANNEDPFIGLYMTANTNPGLPTFFFQKTYGGQTGTQWWNGTGPASATAAASMTSAGSGYNSGFYTFTASGGNCLREPSGVWQGGTVIAEVTDPGFGCTTAATANPATIPGDGAQQATGASSIATTCISNSPISGEMTVTAHVAVAHGVTPGMTYTLQGFGSGFTGYNATYTALPGTSGTTLVGETTAGGGTCPTSPVTMGNEGTALSGTGASTITMPAVSTAGPDGQTGITTKNGQHICGILGEYGDDSPFPGAQFLHMVDDQGNALPGAPALVPIPNQGSANWTGYTLANTQ